MLDAGYDEHVYFMESVARYLRRELPHSRWEMPAQTMSDDRRRLYTGYPANVTIRGIRFAMLDHLRNIVEVLVTHAALDRVEAQTDGRTDYLGRFDKQKKRFERIANDKFARGEIEDDGSVAVLAGDC